MSVLEDLSTTLAGAAARHGPAVVGLGRGWHGGSGAIVESGSVLTAAHNVRGDELTLTFSDGERAAARVRAVDTERDLAVLSAETPDVAPLDWRSGEPALAIGSPVVAVADPGGRGLRVTHGFASAVDRSFRGPRGRRITGCIEHTAPLVRGSSGSPLLDPAGRLLGLNALRLDGNMILAVPAPKTAIEALLRGEVPARVRLGIAVAPPRVARRLRRAVGLPEQDGVLVRSVDSSAPAARAGVAQGDLIVAAGGRSVDGVDSLYSALDNIAPGAALDLTIVRGTDRREVSVEFDRSKEAAQ